MTSVQIDVERYAAIAAELSRDGADRAAILGAHGLDESDWETIEGYWQQRLSTAMDGDFEQEGVPDVVTQYSAAFSKAQAAQAEGDVITLEQFGTATRHMANTSDVQQSLKQLGLTLSQFLKGNQYWCTKMVTDPELAERFRKILAGEE
jgi:hypothetical protein